MAKMTKDMLYQDFKTLKDVNSKLRYSLGVYFITDYGFIYGKHRYPHIESFVVLKDVVDFEYLKNIVIDGDEFYNATKYIGLSQFASTYNNEQNAYVIPFNKVHDKKTETMEEIEGKSLDISVRPREFGLEFKDEVYKMVNHFDLFKLRALPFRELPIDAQEAYASNNIIEIEIGGYPLIFDNSLFPAFNKGDMVPELSVARIPEDYLEESDEFTSYFLFRLDTKLYVQYSLVKTLNV